MSSWLSWTWRVIRRAVLWWSYRSFCRVWRRNGSGFKNISRIFSWLVQSPLTLWVLWRWNTACWLQEGPSKKAQSRGKTHRVPLTSGFWVLWWWDCVFLEVGCCGRLRISCWWITCRCGSDGLVGWWMLYIRVEICLVCSWILLLVTSGCGKARVMASLIVSPLFWE